LFPFHLWRLLTFLTSFSLHLSPPTRDCLLQFNHFPPSTQLPLPSSPSSITPILSFTSILTFHKSRHIPQNRQRSRKSSPPRRFLAHHRRPTRPFHSYMGVSRIPRLRHDHLSSGNTALLSELSETSRYFPFPKVSLFLNLYFASQTLLQPPPPSNDLTSGQYLLSRRSDLMQEFAFWNTVPPRALGGVFELRTYGLKPGKLLEWEGQWRKGLEVRKNFMEPIGAW
jgi:hypothetical protein